MHCLALHLHLEPGTEPGTHVRYVISARHGGNQAIGRQFDDGEGAMRAMQLMWRGIAIPSRDPSDQTL